MTEQRRRKGRRRRGPRFLRNLPLRKIAVGGGILLLAALVGTNVSAIRRQRQGQIRELYDATRRALAVGDLEAAEQAARTVREERPDDRRAIYELALVLEARGRAADARALLVPEAERDDGWHDGRVLLAAIAQSEEDYAGALEWLPDGSEGGRVPATAYRILAEVRAATGDLAGAALAYDLAVELDPEDVVALLGRADLALVEFLDTGRREAKDRALATYAAAERRCRSRLRAAEGSSTAARLGLAKALMGQVRAQGAVSVAAAEDELRAMVAEAGPDPAPTLALADFLHRVGRIGQARRVLEDAVRTFDTPQVRLARARIMAVQGEASNAMAAIEQGIAAHDRSVELRLALVDGLVGAQRFDDAQTAVDALAALASDDARTHEAAGDFARARARAAEDAGDAAGSREFRAAARDAYGAAVRLRPRSMPLMKKLFGERLEAAISGDADLTEADRRAADAYVTDVLRVNPADADALAWRARLLLLEDDPEAVVALLADAVDRPAPSLDLLRLHGLACERTSRDVQSADAFLTILERLTGRRGSEEADPRAAAPADWMRAVGALLRLGRTSQAIGKAEAASRAWPESVELRLLRARARLLGGRTESAVADLTATSVDFPRSADARLLLAAVLESEGRRADADRVLRAHPESSDEVAIALAGLIGRGGDVDAMRRGVEAAVRGSDRPGAANLLAGREYLTLAPPAVDLARAAFEEAARDEGQQRDACVRLADLTLLALAKGDVPPASAEAAVSRAESAGASSHRLAYLRGKLALLSGDPASAAKELRVATSGRRPSPAALYYLARALRADGASEEAEAALDRALALAPGDARMTAEVASVRLELGLEALRAARFEAAVPLLAEGAVDARRDLLLAVARAGMLELDLAVDLARCHLGEQPDDRVAQHLLASVLLQQSTTESARESATVFSSLVEEDPTDVRGWIGLAAARLAVGEPESAEQAFRTAHALAPSDLSIAEGVVDALVAANRGDEAVAFVRGLGSDDPRAERLLGSLLLRRGEFEGAAEAFVRAAEVRPDDSRALLGAVAALAAMHDGGARGFLEERIEPVATQAPAWVALAELRLRDGDLDAAEEALDHARRRAPESAFALVLRGEISAARGRIPEALANFISAEQQGARDTATLLRLAELLASAGRTSRAIRAYERVLTDEPGHVAAANNLALLLGAEGREIDRAVQLAEAAREAAPGSPEVADTLGWLHVQAGRPSEALPLLREAARGLDDDARVHFHLGLAAARVGLGDEAERHLERALEIDPDFPDAAAARSELARLR